MDDHSIGILRDLVKVSEDGEKGFAEAANIATEAKLQMLCHARSRECGGAAKELQQLIVSLGGQANDEGSVAGSVHRGWLKMKSVVQNENIAVLEEIERGEDHAKAAYTKALLATLPPMVRAIVEKQAEGTRRNHDQIRDLRNAYKAEIA